MQCPSAADKTTPGLGHHCHGGLSFFPGLQSHFRYIDPPEPYVIKGKKKAAMSSSRKKTLTV